MGDILGAEGTEKKGDSKYLKERRAELGRRENSRHKGEQLVRLATKENKKQGPKGRDLGEEIEELLTLRRGDHRKSITQEVKNRKGYYNTSKSPGRR